MSYFHSIHSHEKILIINNKKKIKWKSYFLAAIQNDDKKMEIAKKLKEGRVQGGISYTAILNSYTRDLGIVVNMIN